MENTNENEQKVSEPVEQKVSGVVEYKTESETESFADCMHMTVAQQLTIPTMLPIKDHKFGMIVKNKHFTWIMQDR